MNFSICIWNYNCSLSLPQEEINCNYFYWNCMRVSLGCHRKWSVPKNGWKYCLEKVGILYHLTQISKLSKSKLICQSFHEGLEFWSFDLLHLLQAHTNVSWNRNIFCKINSKTLFSYMKVTHESNRELRFVLVYFIYSKSIIIDYWFYFFVTIFEITAFINIPKE